MQIETFFEHWRITENPFAAEEARDDAVFHRLIDGGAGHPDFEKVFGEPGRPRAAVVFGDKGSGKTALRLMVERRIDRHNRDRADAQVWIVRYDDLNPLLDRLAGRYRQPPSTEALLKSVRLHDHMDAILSSSVTRLVDRVLGRAEGVDAVAMRLTARQMPRERRVDLATLALLYDQPRSGAFADRFERLRKLLRLRSVPWNKVLFGGGVILLAAAAVMVVALAIGQGAALWDRLLTGGLIAAAALMLGVGLWRKVGRWVLASRLWREVRTVERLPADLREGLERLWAYGVADQPLPHRGDEDSRFELTDRLLGVLESFGYASMVVLVDRIDEPVRVAGDPQRMKSLVWPMLSSKFLQQERVGIKLMLPIELRHLLLREDGAFYERARLDKQHLIDRVTWSGPLLYDLCTRRLSACRAEGAEPIALIDLFGEEVSRQDVIDALEQMRQPRDAFKFMYGIVLEHCSSVPEDAPVWRIPRLTLDHVRQAQSRRVDEMRQGLSPA